VLRGIREHCTAEGQMRPALLRTPEDIEKWALAEFDYIAQRNGMQMLKGFEAERALIYLDNERTKARQSSMQNLAFYDVGEDDSRGIEDDRPMKMDFIR
jgi:hypothetical protein